MKFNKKIIGYFAILIILLIALFVGGNPFSDEKKTTALEISQSVSYQPEEKKEEQPENKEEINPNNDEKKTELNKTDKNESISSEPIIEIPEKQEEKNGLVCSLYIKCDTILENMDKLEESKKNIIPENGVIYEKKDIEFADGETVFDILLKEMKASNIHMEFENTPVYKSAYIEGIANIYEFDCGELSGWMYSVNGVFPNYGCSEYKLKNNDNIMFVYTCNLGRDVGNNREDVSQNAE